LHRTTKKGVLCPCANTCRAGHGNLLLRVRDRHGRGRQGQQKKGANQDSLFQKRQNSLHGIIPPTFLPEYTRAMKIQDFDGPHHLAE
jgi:hypothetical protein